jgi:GT2 family glycosyltransferase
MERKFDVSVILVNYKTSRLTHMAIESLQRMSHYFSYEIIIVDNSMDENEYKSLYDLRSDSTTLIKASSNLGFGKANNMGAKVASGKYLFFLNTDTLLLNNAIFELYSFMEKNPDVGVCGCNLFTKESKPSHSFYREEKNLQGDLYFSGPLAYITKCLGRRNDFNYSQKPIQIRGYVCGAALMIGNETFQSLNGFDSDIFMYAEEALLCYRVIHELNMKIYNVPSGKITHLEGGSFSSISYNRAKMMVDGNYIYYCKAYGIKSALKYLKTFLHFYRTKLRLSRLFCRNKVASFKSYYDAYSSKIAEENYSIKKS